MNFYRAIVITACLAAPAALAGMVQAPSQQTAPVAHPTRGMTMQQVLARFGEPEQKMTPTPSTAQGPLKPPIVRWVYPDFTVYFEHDYVIHTVLTHPREAPTPRTSNPPRR